MTEWVDSIGCLAFARSCLPDVRLQCRRQLSVWPCSLGECAAASGLGLGALVACTCLVWIAGTAVCWLQTFGE